MFTSPNKDKKGLKIVRNLFFISLSFSPPTSPSPKAAASVALLPLSCQLILVSLIQVRPTDVPLILLFSPHFASLAIMSAADAPAAPVEEVKPEETPAAAPSAEPAAAEPAAAEPAAVCFFLSGVDHFMLSRV